MTFYHFFPVSCMKLLTWQSFSLSPAIAVLQVLTEAITRRTRVSHLLLWFLLCCSCNCNTNCPVYFISRFAKWEDYRWASHSKITWSTAIFNLSIHFLPSSQILYTQHLLLSLAWPQTFLPEACPPFFFFFFRMCQSCLYTACSGWVRLSTKLPFVQLPPQHKGSSTVRFHYTKCPLVQVPPLISTQTKRRSLILEILLMTFQRYGHQSSCSPSGRMLQV